MLETREPHFVVEPGSAHADEVRHASLFRANAAYLLAEWPRLLKEHRDEWVAVYGDSVLIVSDTLESVWNEVPKEARRDAIVKHVVDPQIEAVHQCG